MSELQAQKAYMRQKVQQRQQEAKLQQQAAAVCARRPELDCLCGCAGTALTHVNAMPPRLEACLLISKPCMPSRIMP